ncbi:unnamed protein product [Boreogadus saida]
MIRPSLDPADVFSWRLCWGRGAAFLTFQKGPALYLAFPRGSTFQTFQKGPALYLAIVFADAGHLCVHIAGNYGKNLFTTSESSRERHLMTLL